MCSDHFMTEDWVKTVNVYCCLFHVPTNFFSSTLLIAMESRTFTKVLATYNIPETVKSSLPKKLQWLAPWLRLNYCLIECAVVCRSPGPNYFGGHIGELHWDHEDHHPCILFIFKIATKFFHHPRGWSCFLFTIHPGGQLEADSEACPYLGSAAT